MPCSSRSFSTISWSEYGREWSSASMMFLMTSFTPSDAVKNVENGITSPAGRSTNLPAADARAVGARSEGVSRIRVEALLHPIPVLLDVLAADAQGLGDVAEFVLAEFAKVVGDDRTHVCRDLLANLGEVVDLDQQALAGVASADAPRLDALDRR